MARVRYVSAVRKLDRDLQEFDHSDIPMDPGSGNEPLPWTAEHLDLFTRVTDGFAAVLAARKRWESLLREVRPHS
jgi:hypothetical protein